MTVPVGRKCQCRIFEEFYWKCGRLPQNPGGLTCMPFSLSSFFLEKSKLDFPFGDSCNVEFSKLCCKTVEIHVHVKVIYSPHRQRKFFYVIPKSSLLFVHYVLILNAVNISSSLRSRHFERNYWNCWLPVMRMTTSSQSPHDQSLALNIAWNNVCIIRFYKVSVYSQYCDTQSAYVKLISLHLGYTF